MMRRSPSDVELLDLVERTIGIKLESGYEYGGLCSRIAKGTMILNIDT
jgi:hypothetical protein